VTTGVNHYASTQLAGKALFATGAKVFSVHRSDKDLPYAVVQEYTATTGTVGSLGTSGSQLLVPNGTNVDKIDTNYATATIDTPEMDGDAKMMTVKYDSIGSGGTITFGTNIDNAGSYTSHTTIVDTIRKKAFFDGVLGTVNFIQGRVILTPSGDNNISIKQISIE
jgi:hypothetical protein